MDSHPNKVRFFSNDNEGSRNNSMTETMEGWNKQANVYNSPNSNTSPSVDKSASIKA